MSAAATALAVKFGLAGVCVWCAIAAVSIWSHSNAGEVLMLEIARAEASVDQRTNEPVISITLSETSKRLMAELTQKNIARPTELRVDGRVLMKPVIREPILGGNLQISGNLTAKDAKDIAQKLSSGAKIEVEVVE